MPASPPSPPLVFGRAVLDMERRELLVNGSAAHLRARSFDVLAYLVRHPGRVVTKQELIDEVWLGAAVTDDSIVQCLIDVRRALGAEDAHIRTIRGKGYRFDAAVRPLESNGEGVPTARVEPLTRERRGAGAVTSGPQLRMQPRPWAVGAGFLLAAVGLTWWQWGPLAGDGTAAPAAVTEPRLAPQVTLSANVVQLMVAGNTAIAGRSQAGLQEARRSFEQAVGLDARYAPAHAALADTLTLFFVFGVERPEAVLPKAVEHADLAVELDPTSGLGWHALAHAEVHWTRDWNRAELHYRRALALEPRAEIPSFLLAHLLMGLGRGEEAIAQSLKALSLNPQSPVLQTSSGIVHRFVKGDSAALPFFEQAHALDPRYSVGSFWRALSLAALGRYDEAMDWALRSRDEMSNAPTWVVGYVHARAGRRREAQEVLDAMTAHASRHYVPPMEFAYLSLALGHRDEALRWIEVSVKEHSRWVELLAVDRILEPLRGEPRFRAALASMKLDGAR